MYTIGRGGLAIFGGAEMWPILDPQGEEICTVSGPLERAVDLVHRLNVVVTWAADRADGPNRIVAVTRQDGSGSVIEVLAEAE